MSKVKMSSKTAARLLCLAIVLALISCIGASALQTSFGDVSVTDFSIPTSGGKWIAGKLFKPMSATAENPSPMVITCHGYLNNNEMQDSIAIELSRRGISVIAMDAYFHGESSASQLSVVESCMVEGTGMIELVEYVHSSLDYVDNSRIGIMGHSMGGMNVWFTLVHYGSQYLTAIAEAQLPESEGGEEITEAEQTAANALNKVNAGLTSGNVRLSTEEMFAGIHANVAINYSVYDEGNYDLTRGNGDLSGDCYEALSCVNSGLAEGEKVTSVEIGKLYGNAGDRTLRVVYNPKTTHQLQHFSLESTADNVEFFTAAFGVENTLGENQTWLVKELFNALGMAACFLAVVPMAVLLLEVPVFADLKTEIPEELPALNTKRRKLFFWGGWIISWIISWLSFMPVQTLDTVIFPNTAAMGIVSAFPQQCNNTVLLWAVFNGVVGILLFWLSYVLGGKKDGVNPAMWGIQIGVKTFLKTLALAVCVFVGFYGFLFAAEYFFNTDFRFWFIAVCDFTADKLLVAAQYVPFFFVFFAANAILTNSVNRVGGQKEWLNVLICGIGNALGVVLVNLQQYVVLFTTGNALFGATRLYPMTALPLILFLFIAAYINRALFKATGKVWLGALVNTLIIVMISVANTATLLPL